ncbi:hypothetical protein OG277_37685 [Streptomyces phaeochromogenes]|nr:hypothetical protein OG277_37685 [Streptomyces phaeochromogenes]
MSGNPAGSGPQGNALDGPSGRPKLRFETDRNSCPVDPAEQAAAFGEVGHEQLGRRSAEGHLAGPLRLSGFRPQMDQPVGGLEVLHVELDKLFAAKGTVVGEGDHQLIAQRLLGRRGQDPLPDVLVGNPGRLLDAAYKTATWPAAATTQLTPADRVLLSE